MNHRDRAKLIVDAAREAGANGGYDEQITVVSKALHDVERETWLRAADVVRNQFGVSEWTEVDTVELLEQHSKESTNEELLKPTVHWEIKVPETEETSDVTSVGDE